MSPTFSKRTGWRASAPGPRSNGEAQREGPPRRSRLGRHPPRRRHLAPAGAARPDPARHPAPVDDRHPRDHLRHRALIMLHEAGNYFTAKRAGMKVTEFFLGFGPRVWSFRRGETEYGVKAIPAGGYVRIVGMSNLEEVDPADEPRTFRQGTPGKRLAVI